MRSSYLVFGQPPIEQPEIDEVLGCLRSAWLGTGPKAAEFERRIAAYKGVPYAVGLNSCTAGLHLACVVLGLQPGDEVITTPFTFDATMEAIILLDAVPVFVDILPGDLNLDPARIEDAITPRTRAIMPVPIFGAPCDMDAINGIAARRGLEVIMDNAQAFGTLYKGKPISSCGRMATLSFYPTKNLPGIGDGGAVCCRDKADAELIRRIRGHQPVRANNHLYTGWNSRLDEVQAMVIRVRLARFFDEQHDRDQVAAIYDSYIPAENRVQLDAGGQGMRMTYHQYWVRCSDRAGLHRALDKAGVDVGIYYDPPLHRHELAVYCRAAGPLPEAERAGREILTLPIHAALPFEDAHRVGAVVREFMSASGGHGA